MPPSAPCGRPDASRRPTTPWSPWPAPSPTPSTSSSLGCPPRWATPRRADRISVGDGVDTVARLLRMPLLPWQRVVADVAGELVDGGGRFAYPLVVVVVPRRAGKTALTLAT